MAHLHDPPRASRTRQRMSALPRGRGSASVPPAWQAQGILPALRNYDTCRANTRSEALHEWSHVVNKDRLQGMVTRARSAHNSRAT